ncbi:MAG: hypothetical protein H6729_12170 [Deltaproteobacteria bacterium]|nr:hypothetical protein [Deltaproteobacteria bacterium]
MEQHQRDMQLLLATVDAVVDLWPAMSRPTEQTPRWILDITSILAVLIERQADHFALEEHARFVARQRQGAPDRSPTQALDRLRAEHARLHAATRDVREKLRELGPDQPLEAKTRLLAVLAMLKRHEHEEKTALHHFPDESEHRPVVAESLGASSRCAQQHETP